MLEDVLNSRLDPYFKTHWIKACIFFAISVIRHLTCSKFEVQNSCRVSCSLLFTCCTGDPSPSGKDQTENI